LLRLAPYLPWLSAITITDSNSIEPIARFWGVALLLFMIGLELSFERLWADAPACVRHGQPSGHVFARAVLCIVAVLLGCSWISAMVIGLALTMSSHRRGDPDPGGREAAQHCHWPRQPSPYCCFQDIAVVPVLFALGAVGPSNHAGECRCPSVSRSATPLLSVAAIVVLGRLVLAPIVPPSVARNSQCGTVS